uniref:Phytanoyl-CoA dioxygenase n=1 Tax=Parasteatoda tepidariorum TaxID=114398 RepID=A0A2L2XYK1_PARTP
MKIEQALIEEYEKNGAICLRGVFDENWIEIVRAGIEKNLNDPSCYSEKLKGEKGNGYYFDDYCNWKRIEEFKKFALESPAAAIAGTLTRSEEISFYHEHVLVKDAGTDKKTPWHHDQSYYPVDGEKVCSIWMPVDPVPRETCVQFVAGSHKWGWYSPRKFETTQPYKVIDETLCSEKNYQQVPDIEANKEQWNILCWDLQPGDCIVFHMKCLHGAPGNMSTTHSRRVLSTRWLGDDATLARRPWEISPPITGGLQIGQRMVCKEFPVVWKNEE